MDVNEKAHAIEFADPNGKTGGVLYPKPSPGKRSKAGRGQRAMRFLWPCSIEDMRLF